jgi:hypothetical protein
MLHLQKSSPRTISSATHPSAVWAVVEVPGIILAKEWMPDSEHQDWVVMFDQFLAGDNQRFPWVQSQEIDQWNYSEIEAEQVHRQLAKQHFVTRQEALDAVETALMMCASRRPSSPHSS